MPGGDNTIALLSNIVKKLDIITDTVVRSADPNNQRKEAEQNLINNRKTGLTSAKPIETPNAEQKKIEASVINPNNDISIKSIVSFLNSLPTAVKIVADLGKKDINQFESTLTKISSSIVNFVKTINIDDVSKDSIEKYKITIDAISNLESSIKKIGLLLPIIPLYNLSIKLLSSGIDGIVNISKKLENFGKSKDAINGVTAINKMLKGFGVVVGSIIAMGIAIKLVGTENIVKGAAVVISVITLLSALSIGVLKLASYIEKSTESLSSVTNFIKEILVLTAATMLMGVVVQSNWNVMLNGLAAIGAVMVAYSALAIATAFVGSIMKNVNDGKSFENILKFMVGTVLITAATIGLAHLVNTVSFNQIASAFGMVTGIVVLSLGVALLMQLVKSPIENGTKSLIPIGLFIMSTTGIILASILIIKVKELSGVEWSEILTTFGVMSSIVIAIGGLAVAAGAVQSLIAKGLPAIGMCALLAAGMTFVLGGIIGMTSIAYSAFGKAWGVEILKSIGLMGLIVTEFGLLAGIAGALIIPIGIGIPALAGVELLALGAVHVVKKIADLQLYMDKANLSEDKIRMTVTTIKNIVNDLVGMVKDISFGGEGKGILGKIGSAASIVGKSATLGILMGSITMITRSISSIAEIVTPDGKYIRPSRVVNGKIIAGEPVDILAAGQTIIATVKQFANLITEEFTNIKVRDIARATVSMIGISAMLDPISNFTRALMSFDSSDGSTLRTVTITPDGKVVTGPTINTIGVASAIAKAIGNFALTLFSEENAALWKRMTEGSGLIRKSASEKAMGILSTVIEPVISFVDVMSKFGNQGDLITVADAAGKTRTINLAAIGKSIAQGVTAFVSEIGSMDMGDNIENAKALTKILKTSLEPVTKFVNMIIPYADSPAGMLPEFDSTGKKIRDIDVVATAQNISSSAKLFAASITELQSGMIIDRTGVSMSSTVMTKYINDLVKVTGGKADKQLSNFANTIKTDTKSLQDFDNVLNNGNKKRIENINSLGDAVEALGKRIADSEEGLNALVSIFESLNEINPERIRSGIDEAMRIGQLSKKDAKNLASLQGAMGTSGENIESAIRNALANTTIKVPDIEINSFGHDTGRPGYEINGVDLAFK